MKTKSLNFIVPLIIYPFDVMISFGETNQEIDKHFEKYGLTAEDIDSATITSPTVQGRTVMFSTNQTLIRLLAIPKTPTEYGNLAHEIFHAVTFVMDRIGMTLKVEESDEAYAYLIDYLTKKIYERI